MRVSNPQPAEFVLGAQMRAVILTRGAETDGRHDLVEAVQQPGTTTPLHLHTRYDERLWVIEGEITAWVGEHEYRVGAGGLVTIPMTTPHMIKAGPRGVRALNISSPAGFAELIERAAVPAAQARPGTELDVDRFMQVSTELGDVVLGPPGTTPDQLAPGVRTLRTALHERQQTE